MNAGEACAVAYFRDFVYSVGPVFFATTVHKCCTPVNEAMSEISNRWHYFLSNSCINIFSVIIIIIIIIIIVNVSLFVCLFQCKPTALLRAPGSAQGG